MDSLSNLPWWLWIVLTLVAAAAQTGRNAAQKGLTATLGTMGATGVRFFFGLPFAALSLLVMLAVTGATLPRIDATFAGWVVLGAGAQIAATALMLAAMKLRSFVIATAYTKTEALQVAVFALVVLHERLSWLAIVAIVVATAGVLLMSWPKRPTDRQRPGGPAVPAGQAGPAATAGGVVGRVAGAGAGDTTGVGRAAVLGLAAGAMFALSAVGFKGAIVSLQLEAFVIAATFTLVCGLLFQSVVLAAWQLLRSRDVLVATLRAWRASLGAGFLGALASQMWFLAFAIAPTAQVRTLGMVEILFAHVLTRGLFSQKTTGRELAGITLIVLGTVLLING